MTGAQAYRDTHVLVRPYPTPQEPVVATAWNHQLRLDAADDPRLVQFIIAFQRGSQAPERGAPCHFGTSATTLSVPGTRDWPGQVISRQPCNR